MKKTQFTVLFSMLVIVLAGSSQVFADEHSPRNANDIRMAVVKDNVWLDSHSEENRRAILDILVQRPELPAKFALLEEKIRRLVHRDETQGYISAIISILNTCPAEVRARFNASDLSQVSFMPEVMYYNGQSQDLAVTFTPYSNCSDASCPYITNCTIDESADDCSGTSFLTMIQNIYTPIQQQCSSAIEAKELVKHSAKLEAPVLRDNSKGAQSL